MESDAVYKLYTLPELTQSMIIKQLLGDIHSLSALNQCSKQYYLLSRAYLLRIKSMLNIMSLHKTTAMKAYLQLTSNLTYDELNSLFNFAFGYIDDAGTQKELSLGTISNVKVTARDLAAIVKVDKEFDLLLEKFNVVACFLFACKVGALWIVKYLLDTKKIDPQTKEHLAVDANGNSALHIAVAKNHPSIVELFLRSNIIFVDHVNQREERPIHVAIQNDNASMVELLVEYKASVAVSTKQSHGKSATVYELAQHSNNAKLKQHIERRMQEQREYDHNTMGWSIFDQIYSTKSPN